MRSDEEIKKLQEPDIKHGIGQPEKMKIYTKKYTGKLTFEKCKAIAIETMENDKIAVCFLVADNGADMFIKENDVVRPSKSQKEYDKYRKLSYNNLLIKP